MVQVRVIMTIEDQGRKPGYYRYSIFANDPVLGRHCIGGSDHPTLSLANRKEVEARYYTNSGYHKGVIEFIY